MFDIKNCDDTVYAIKNMVETENTKLLKPFNPEMITFR